MGGRGSVHGEKATAGPLVGALAQLAVALMLLACLDPGRLLDELVLVGVVAYLVSMVHQGCLVALVVEFVTTALGVFGSCGFGDGVGGPAANHD